MRHKPSLMILDDNVMMQQFLGNFLREDYEITGFQHVLNAWKWLNDGNTADLILVDIKMPDISGIQFLEQVKTSELHQDIPIIMLSGVDKSGERIKCLRLGAVDYILKPFNPQELKIRLHQQMLLHNSNKSSV